MEVTAKLISIGNAAEGTSSKGPWRMAQAIFETQEQYSKTIAVDFFNTPIKTPHGLLSSAKQAKNYMDVFEKIYQYALDFYEKGDALENTGNKPTIKDRPQALKLPFNET